MLISHAQRENAKSFYKHNMNVVCIENALSSNLLEILQDVCKTGEYRCSYNGWPREVVKTSNPVLIKDINSSLTDKIMSEVGHLFPKCDDIGCMWYGWIRGSYIPWHSDSNSKFGATIYLNQYWDDDWGGYFAYKENGEIKCIKPEFNKMTIIKPPIKHTVFGLADIAPIRETIQIFGR